MRTICILCEMSTFNYTIFEDIEDTFPCFTYYKKIKENLMEATIKCRQEDAASIEKKLAPIV